MASKPAIRVKGGNQDPVIFRADNSGLDLGSYGFSVKYMGSRSGNDNSLSFFSDDKLAATQIEALTIVQDGKIGIGTHLPDEILHIKQSEASTGGGHSIARIEYYATDDFADGDGCSIKFAGGDAAEPNNVIGRLTVSRDGADNEGAFAFKCGTDGEEEFMRIASDGAIYAYELDSTAGTNYVRYHTTTGRITYATSKKETKTNIKKLKKSDGIGVINQLRPIKFESKNERGNIRTGFVAEEVAEVDASLVSYGLDYKHHKTTGGIVTGSDGKKMVKSDKLVPQMWEFEAVIAHLVKAVQQHNTIIEKLKQEIEKMKKN